MSSWFNNFWRKQRKFEFLIQSFVKFADFNTKLQSQKRRNASENRKYSEQSKL